MINVLQNLSSCRDHGKENGNYYSILVLFRDSGKENGSYYSILVLFRDSGKEQMEATIV